MKTKLPFLFMASALLVGARPVLAANSFKLQPLPFTNFTHVQLSGPSGSNFVVQISTNLSGWQNLWYDSFQSNTYVFVDLQTELTSTRFYRGLFANSPIQLRLTQSNKVIQVPPMTLVQIGVTGLSTNTPVFVQFYTSDGVIANVPPVQITSSNLTVSVPPLLTQGGATFTNGLLNARIVQYIGNQAVMSKPFPAVQVQAILPSKVTPGMLTLSLLEASLSSATNIQANLLGSGFDNTNTETSLSYLISSLQGLITNIQQAVTNPNYTCTWRIPNPTETGAPLCPTGFVLILANHETGNHLVCAPSRPTGHAPQPRRCQRPASLDFQRGEPFEAM